MNPKEIHLLVTICEDHTVDTPQDVNTLDVVDTNTGSGIVLIGNVDLHATLVFNPISNKIGWQEWYLPDMPFTEGALINVADVAIDNGTIVISDPIMVAGEGEHIGLLSQLDYGY